MLNIQLLTSSVRTPKDGGGGASVFPETSICPEYASRRFLWNVANFYSLLHGFTSRKTVICTTL